MKKNPYKSKTKERESESLNLQKRIIKQIEAGDLLPGEKLYSERVMADIYGVSRMTVKYAMNALVNKGYVYRVHGSGTFVRQQAVDKMDLSYISETGNGGITAIMTNYGAKISSKVLTKGIVNARFFTHKLGLDENEDVYVLHRIRYGNDEPIAVEYTYLPAAYFEGIDHVDFSRVSLYDFMDSMGRMPKKFNQKLHIMDVSDREHGALELNEKDAVYYLEFIGYDEEGTIVEYTESYVRCDKFEFRFENPS